MSEYTSTIFKLPVSRYFIITIGSDRDNGSVLQDMDFYFQNVCNNLFVCILLHWCLACLNICVRVSTLIFCLGQR